MNRNIQLQKVFEKIINFDGIGLVSVLKECHDVNGVIDDKTVLMLVVNSNWNRNDINCLSKVKYIVKVLIEHGANVNFKNTSGLTALHVVVRGLKEVIDVEIVQYLLDNGANPNKVDNLGKPPICYCVDKWMERVLQMFQSHGANFRTKDNEGNTVLDYTWSTLTFREILKYDVDVNAQDNNGNTPLHLQIWRCYSIGDTGEDSVIDLLIQNNANVNIKNKNGTTPLFVACGIKNKDFSVRIAKILLEACAKVSIPVSRKNIKRMPNGFVDFLDGETALHIAIRLKNLPLIQLLIDYHRDWFSKPSYYDSIHGFLLFILTGTDYDQIMCYIDKTIQIQRQQLFSYLSKSWIRQPHYEQTSSISKRLGYITSSLLSFSNIPTKLIEKRNMSLLTATSTLIVVLVALAGFTNRKNK